MRALSRASTSYFLGRCEGQWAGTCPAMTSQQSLRPLEVRDLGPLAFGLSSDRRLGQAGLAAFHHESMFERIPRRFDVRRARASLVVANVVADQMAGDAELHIGLDVLVVGHVELRDQSFEARLINQKMQVSGAHIVAPLRAQQFADRAVDRNGITRRLEAAEADMAVRSGR